jgi:hypothetical protein
MCFEIEHSGVIFDDLRAFSIDFLERESAKGSDPGLCIAESDRLADPLLLINYGKRAKKEILTKELAYQTAEKAGVHLSEHGGTGGGVIGALAGVGLRLTGNDGRIKGKFKFPIPGNILTVKEILDNSSIDRVQSIEGHLIPKDTKIILGDKVKAVFLDHRQVLLVYQKLDEQTGMRHWHTCIKEQLKTY